MSERLTAEEYHLLQRKCEERCDNCGSMRSCEDCSRGGDGRGGVDNYTPDEDVAQWRRALAEIDALRAEVEELKSERDDDADTGMPWEAAHHMMAADIKEIAELKAEIERLKTIIALSGEPAPVVKSFTTT